LFGSCEGHDQATHILLFMFELASSTLGLLMPSIPIKLEIGNPSFLMRVALINPGTAPWFRRYRRFRPSTAPQVRGQRDHPSTRLFVSFQHSRRNALPDGPLADAKHPCNLGNGVPPPGSGGTALEFRRFRVSSAIVHGLGIILEAEGICRLDGSSDTDSPAP
jgi:hypothetical protein